MLRITQRRFVIIPAGGTGSRMQSDLPKQFLLLNEVPVIIHTLRLFLAVDGIEKIIVPVADVWKDYFNELKLKYELPSTIETVTAGETRFHSVKNALKVLPDEGMVSIHDAAQPLASKELIEKCFSVTVEKGNAVAAIPLRDSVYKIKKGETKSMNRNNYRLAQTPQCFLLSEIKKAFKQEYQKSFTDDASVYEAAEYKVNLTEGENTNFKITNAEDLLFAEIILKNRK